MQEKSKSPIKFKIYYIDYSLGLLSPMSFWQKKIGLVCHDSSESSIDFYYIFCNFISFSLEASFSPTIPYCLLQFY